MNDFTKAIKYETEILKNSYHKPPDEYLSRRPTARVYDLGGQLNKKRKRVSKFIGEV